MSDALLRAIRDMGDILSGRVSAGVWAGGCYGAGQAVSRKTCRREYAGNVDEQAEDPRLSSGRTTPAKPMPQGAIASMFPGFRRKTMSDAANGANASK